MSRRLTLEEAKATETLRYANSFTRMAAVLGLRNRMKKADWLCLLGDNWSICDGLYRHEPQLRAVLDQRAPIREMMTPDEFAQWEALPPKLVAYRGASRRYPPGISWSLEKDIAAKFPFLNRYRVEDPALFMAEVRKQDVLALKGDREEAEAIILNATIVEISPLTR